MTVAWRTGRPVRLEEIADVIDSVEDDKTASWLYINPDDGVRSVSLMVFRQPGSNTIEVIDAIKKLIPAFNAQLPPSVRLNLRGDRSKTIPDSFRDIQFTMTSPPTPALFLIFPFLPKPS